MLIAGRFAWRLLAEGPAGSITVRPARPPTRGCSTRSVHVPVGPTGHHLVVDGGQTVGLDLLEDVA